MLMRGSFIVPDMTEQGLVQVLQNCCCVFVDNKLFFLCVFFSTESLKIFSTNLISSSFN